MIHIERMVVSEISLNTTYGMHGDREDNTNAVIRFVTSNRNEPQSYIGLAIKRNTIPNWPIVGKRLTVRIELEDDHAR